MKNYYREHSLVIPFCKVLLVQGSMVRLADEVKIHLSDIDKFTEAYTTWLNSQGNQNETVL